MKHPADEEPADAAVTVGEGGMSRTGRVQRGGSDRIMRRAVHIVDQVAHQDIDSVGWSGDVRRPVWCRATDPTEAVSPYALVEVVEIRRCHENPVPIPQRLESKPSLLCQRGIYGAEVVGDPRSRATDRWVYVGDGDVLGGSVDRLDPTGRDPPVSQ